MRDAYTESGEVSATMTTRLLRETNARGSGEEGLVSRLLDGIPVLIKGAAGGDGDDAAVLVNEGPGFAI